MRAAAQLPPIASTPGSLEQPLPIPAWVEPPSALDALIRSGPEVHRGPAEELSALAPGSSGEDSGRQEIATWEPQPGAPLPPVARFSLTRVQSDSEPARRQILPAPIAPQAAATPASTTGIEMVPTLRRPTAPPRSARQVLPAPHTVASVAPPGYETPFAPQSPPANVASTRRGHVVRQPGLPASVTTEWAN
ncbi:MAG: hypothetical protein D6753_17695 [Planctomycetota bacterium]|nr:MAG: hypothetical protein D6753_17695 [Planctomycetota bacterium]